MESDTRMAVIKNTIILLTLLLLACPLANTVRADAPAQSASQSQVTNLPDDSTDLVSIKEIRLSGNTLLTADQIFAGLPAVFDSSPEATGKVETQYLYDFTKVKELISQPGTTQQISFRTIQGLTRYILSVYKDLNYSGIFVYVPKEVLEGGIELKNDVLIIKVIEAPVSTLGITYFDSNSNEVEEGYLKRSFIEDWSPAKEGQVADQKKLDDFLNLLNLNPDRYVSATVSEGNQPDTLAIQYDILEVNPWHYFVQIDNSGTKDRQWTPRVGIINTNLLGFDDKFTAVYQSTFDKTSQDNYSVFGSYDFPLWGPKLRLTAYGGYSEFDIKPDGGPFRFLGSGQFYGALLRYNVMQDQGWFFDVLGGYSHEESKVTPSVFPEFLATDIKVEIVSVGFDLHRSDDMTDTSLSFTRADSLKGRGSGAAEFSTSRAGTGDNFTIYYANASHSVFMDPDKIQRLSGTFRWTDSNKRLPPGRMTSFGGLYSVRGYDEYEIVADGGILASLQYEYDLVKDEEAQEKSSPTDKPWIRKLAPLAFLDYGKAIVKDASTTENRKEELFSIGIGALLELGDNFTGGVYYGYPLIRTPDTHRGKGRVNALFVIKW